MKYSFLFLIICITPSLLSAQIGMTKEEARQINIQEMEELERANNTSSSEILSDIFSAIRQGKRLGELIKLAEKELEKKNYLASLEIMEQAVIMSPQDGNVLASRAVVKLKMGRYVEAIFDYNRAIKYRPYDEDLYIDRNYCYRKLKLYKEAVDDSEKAMRLFPQSRVYVIVRAYSNFELGKFEVVCSDLKYAEKMKSLSAVEAFCMSEALSKLKRWEDADAYLNLVLISEPGNVEAHELRMKNSWAQLCTATTKNDSISRLVKNGQYTIELIISDTNSVSALNMIDSNYRASSKYIDARRLIEEKITENNRNYFIYDRLAFALYKTGNYKDAITYYKKAESLGGINYMLPDFYKVALKEMNKKTKGPPNSNNSAKSVKTSKH